MVLVVVPTCGTGVGITVFVVAPTERSDCFGAVSFHTVLYPRSAGSQIDLRGTVVNQQAEIWTKLCHFHLQRKLCTALPPAQQGGLANFSKNRGYFCGMPVKRIYFNPPTKNKEAADERAARKT